MLRKALCFVVLFFSVVSVRAQQDTLPQRQYKVRKIVLASATSLISAGSLLGLNQLWYSQYNTGKFHFFNDNKEWLQMDKVGHAYSAYQMSRLMMQAFSWAGYSRKQQLFIGGGIGVAYLTVIECMDGFSRGWGYSWGDQLANIAGSSIAVAQEAYWREQRFQLKFSYARSGLAGYNPGLLGENEYSRVLKDYNGQTYWLSINPSAFLSKTSRLPKWFSVSIGYSAYGMLGGFSNRMIAVDEKGNVLRMDRQRRYYLSFDVDLTRIKTNSRFLKRVFSVVNILKFPAPAIQFSKNGLRVYGLYY